ncbi:dihydrodipicolinate synthase family protein [Urechidicola vernalis]|uniref:Dihydrodipicolinate synthase family protein n=1 Tax=Urechidicola vernalis TaxID=3075600 RepID=A0ABU2YAD2_9FLAO|nr:dihydrodipicolinate synthase family protein [Urechidicola sp. P050]MDT0554023.1 dihydrodipicolinate synthase family protein [Urechidicola sp. P050]
MNIKNLIAATYTPLKDDGSLNVDLVPRYNEFLKKNKVAGVFVNGSTGDFVSLTVDERKEIIEAWSKVKSDDFFVINHVGHTSLKVSKDLVTHCADKVDAISTLAPYYFTVPTLESLVEYCAEIAACAPHLPFYYYHIPVLSGADFSMLEFLKLAETKIPNLGGIKFTKNDVIDYRYCKNYKNGKYNILYGVDEMLLSSLPYEATGWVGSTYNHLAPLYYGIIEAFKLGDHTLASQLQTKSAQFVDELNGRGGFNGAGKSFMKVLGVDCGPCRYPHKTFSDEELSEVKKILTNSGIMDYTSKL